MVDKDEVEELSQRMFEATFAYKLNPDKVVNATGVGRNTVIRIQSGNPFVEQDDLIKVKEYVDKYYYDSRQKYYTRIEDDSCGGLGYSVVNLSTLTIVADFIDRDDAYRYASNDKNLWVHIDKAYVHQSMRPLRELDKCSYEPKHMSKETNNGR